jgi:hypothetical protein
MNDGVYNELLCLLYIPVLDFGISLTYQYLVPECVCFVTFILLANK